MKTYIRKADRTPVLKLIYAKRLNGTAHGHPRYLFGIAGGDTLMLASDVSYAYEVDNHPFPRFARVHLTPGGRVERITELSQDERISAKIEERRAELADGWQYGNVHGFLNDLRFIEQHDPAGWAHREPSEQDCASFRAWVLMVYGENHWVAYEAGGWGNPPNV
jgi:hypothetical protein